jgi:hypothetical protein
VRSTGATNKRVPDVMTGFIGLLVQSLGITVNYNNSQRICGDKPLETHDRWYFFQLNTCDHSPYVTPSLTRNWVCHLQLLLAPDSAVILRFESRGTHNHILLSQARDSPNLEGQVPVFIPSRYRMARLYPQALGSLFVSFYDSQGYGGGIRTRLHTRSPAWTRNQSYVTTDGQSANLSWNKAPIWGLRPDLYYCQTVAGLWCGARSLTRGRVCCLPESQSAVVSLLSVCTIYIITCY